MSRLYGRSDDVYKISKYLIESDIKEYKKDNRKISMDDIIECPSSLEIYLPDKALEILSDTPIVLAKTIFAKEPITFMPNDKKESPEIYFPKYRMIEEHKNDVIFFLGRILASYSPDEMPKYFNIPCEYHDVIPILLTYLFSKENGKEDTFSSKFLNELAYNARSYVKTYDDYQNYLTAKQANNMFGTSNSLDKYEESNKNAILLKTLTHLVPLSSMDATLQLVDEIKEPTEYKEILEKLILNPNHNREKIIESMGIDSYGFKRLRKEIDFNKKR